MLLSAAMAALSMLAISRSRHITAGRRLGSVWGSGLLGFGSGALLGAAATGGRPVGVVLVVALVCGLAMGLVTTGASYQVRVMTKRAREALEARSVPDEPIEFDD